MTKKIFQSILIAVTGVLLSSLVLIVGVLYSYFTTTQENQLHQMLLLSCAGAENSGMSYFQDLDEECRVTWVDATGVVLYDSQNIASTMGNHANREEIKEALEIGEGKCVRYSDTLMQKTIYQTKRLSDGSVLRVSLSSASVWLLVIGMLQPISIIFVIALVISGIIAHKLSRHITRPLDDIDLEHPLEIKTYEELLPFLKKIDIQHKQITIQKKELAEKRLSMEFAEENRKEFTANVSHELKTPLQAIMGSAELIENGIVKPEDLSRFAGNIRKESTRLLNLIEDIIHLSRLDENESLTLEPVFIHDICVDEIRALTPVANQYGVKLYLQGDEFSIQGLTQLVQEIIHNLIDNAIKYNKVGGQVMIRLTETTNKFILSVSDNGIGISKDEQDRIFERFYRVDKSHSRATGGTGLGLSIVKHAVQYMQGDISIESELGVGTSISIKFPK